MATRKKTDGAQAELGVANGGAHGLILSTLDLHNVRSITRASFEFGPMGAVFSGTSGAGKSSVLRAVLAVLGRAGLDGKLVRNGEDEARIEIGFSNGATVVQKQKKGGGAEPPKLLHDGVKGGVSDLQSMLGIGAPVFDVIAYAGLDKKGIRAHVLGCMPMSLTPSFASKFAPDVPTHFTYEGHGLEALARLEKVYYDRRYDANREVDKTKSDAARAIDAAELASRGVAEDAPSVAAADAAEREAVTALAVLRAEASSAEKARVQRDVTIAAIQRKRSDATKATEGIEPIDPSRFADGEKALDVAKKKLVESEGLLASIVAFQNGMLRRHDIERAEMDRRHAAERAEQERAVEEARGFDTENRQAEHKIVAGIATLRERDEAYRRAVARAAELTADADEAERALGAADAGKVSPEAIAEAETCIEAARVACAAARRAEAAMLAKKTAADARAKAKAAIEAAEALDKIVVALQKDAPAALAMEAGGIPGIRVTADDITLDGVSLMERSSGEQLRDGVTFAKRIGAQSNWRVLFINDLNRLGPAAQLDLLRDVCGDGWQVLATITTDDKTLTVHAIDEKYLARDVE